MIRIPSGWYADALPSGEYVALVKDSHLVTDRARIELPRGQNLLFLDLSPDGIHFAGIGHSDDHCWEWVGDGWLDRGIAFGPFAVGYDAAGELHIITGPPAVGYRRYPVTAEATYADKARQVWGFTDLPNCTIGQGGDGPHGEDPAIVLIGVVRRLIEDGRCRAIKARQQGDLVSLAYCREDSEEAVIRWLTLDQLRGLQPVSSQPPQPVPVPPPTPEPIPMSLPDPTAVLHALEGERAKHQPDADGKYTNEQMGAMLNGAAGQFPDVGMHFRTGEKAATAPGVSRTFSRDVLRYLPAGDDFGWWSDVLGATGAGLAIPLAPEWQRSTDDRVSFVPPARVVVQPPPPPPDPLPSGDLETRVRVLEQWKARVQA